MFDVTLPFDAHSAGAHGLHAAAAPESCPAVSSHAAQRTRGALRLAFKAQGGVTAPAVLYQEGALKVRLPRVRTGVPEAVIINTAGGLTGGDAVGIAVEMQAASSAVIAGQACEKIYKSAGGDACISSALTLSSMARLDWLVQPTILFDRGRLRRSMTVEMAADATLLAVEAIVFGRTAMDEQVQTGFVSDSWRIRRDGTLIYADTFRVDGEAGAILSNPAALAGCRAMASVIYVAPDAEERRAALRDMIADIPDPVAVSAWDGKLILRLAAADGYALTRALVTILTRFRAQPMPRVWMI